MVKNKRSATQKYERLHSLPVRLENCIIIVPKKKLMLFKVTSLKVTSHYYKNGWFYFFSIEPEWTANVKMAESSACCSFVLNKPLSMSNRLWQKTAACLVRQPRNGTIKCAKIQTMCDVPSWKLLIPFLENRASLNSEETKRFAQEDYHWSTMSRTIFVIVSRCWPWRL